MTGPDVREDSRPDEEAGALDSVLQHQPTFLFADLDVLANLGACALVNQWTDARARLFRRTDPEAHHGIHESL